MAASSPPLPCVTVKSLYGPQFHDRRTPGSVRSAEIILPSLIHRFGPASVVDVGCGVGAWLSVVEAHGGIDVVGVDGPWVSMDDFALDEDCFVECNLAISDPGLDAKFDMCISTEVAEHLPDGRSRPFVALLCRLADVVVFSAAVPGQGGMGHVNEQWQSYWAALFRGNGFGALDLIRPRIWDNEDVDAWYRQNLLVFVRDAEDDVAMMDVVHPVFVERGLERKKSESGWRSPARLGRRAVRRVRDAV